ncbi:MAG: ribonuclease [Bacteroidota bacterium]|jgi:ribonuclease R
MSKKDKKSSKNKLSVKELQTAILKLFLANPKKNYSAKQIIDKLDIDNNKDSVRYALEQLSETGKLDVAKVSFAIKRPKEIAKEIEKEIKLATKAASKKEIAKKEDPKKEGKKESKKEDKKSDKKIKITEKKDVKGQAANVSTSETTGTKVVDVAPKQAPEKAPVITQSPTPAARPSETPKPAQAPPQQQKKENNPPAAKPQEKQQEKQQEKRPERQAENQSENQQQRSKDEPKPGQNQQRTFDGPTHTGTVDMTRSGAAYVVCDGLESDIYVPARFTNFALQGDTVKVRLLPQRGNKRRMEGEVVEVVTRANEYFIGTYRVLRRYALVLPDNQNVPFDIFIDFKDNKGAEDGQKVIVKVVRWQNRVAKQPMGEVTKVLGAMGSNDMAMNTILINHGFNIEFPEEVMKESDAISTEIEEDEIARRRDMRKVTTFTVDPVDAKDFDDALSYQELESGRIEIGIHIADVAHYVHLNTQIDKEAFRRSTSVYLADRVCPMLPEKLSNELCSLRPNEDKLTFSAVFEFDKRGKIVSRWFGRTVIHSDHRFSYEGAQEVLDNGEGVFLKELQQLDKYAKILRKEKFKNGAIAFESDEVRFRLDENGVPTDVFTKERRDTNLLIEDFMLLANKEVAKFIADKGKEIEVPYIYRIHDTPNTEKLTEFVAFALQLGVKMNVSTPKKIAESFNNLTKEAEKNESLKILMPIAIRCMAKAIYSSDNIGHYGLGFEHYSHFTSPIRRYSDVLAHRILAANLGEKIFRADKAKLEEGCKHISKQERLAMECERESTKLKQVEFMTKQIGQEFDGIISGMIERGIFVETRHGKCEGLIRFDTLQDTFDLQNGNLIAKGKNTGVIYKMGDNIRVKILAADLERKQIEMEVIKKVE